jgi:hypothetical protein
MGQYHTVYNLDKKEYYSIGGAKLWEKAYCPLASMGLNVLLANSNGRGGGDLNNPILDSIEKPKTYWYWSNEKQKKVRAHSAEYAHVAAALREVSGRWAGDRIVIQGDYAKKGDPAFISERRRKDFVDITPLVVVAFEEVFKYHPEDAELSQRLQTEKRFKGIK